MATPIDAIAADAAGAVEAAPEAAMEAGQAPPSPSVFSRLLEPSPRSWPELDGDEYAQILNAKLQERLGGDPAKCRVGQSVMDCVYALSGSSAGNAAPLVRLGTSGARYVLNLRGGEHGGDGASVRDG